MGFRSRFLSDPIARRELGGTRLRIAPSMVWQALVRLAWVRPAFELLGWVRLVLAVHQERAVALGVIQRLGHGGDGGKGGNLLADRLDRDLMAGQDEHIVVQAVAEPHQTTGYGQQLSASLFHMRA